MSGAPFNNDDNEEIEEENKPHSSLKDEIVGGTKNIVGNFETNVVIQDAVRQIPYIGEPLYVLLSYTAQRIGQQRLIQSLAILQEEINLIDENKVDKAFLQTEDFFDILRIVFENSIKTRHRERIRINCKILVGAINIDKIQDRRSAEDFLYAVADLSPIDIMVGREIYNLQKDRPVRFDRTSEDNNENVFVEKSHVQYLRHICKIDDVDFDIAVHKLAAVGLIKQTGLGFVGNMHDLYIITPMFLKLMNFILIRANDPLFNLMIRHPDSYLTSEEARGLRESLKALGERDYETFANTDELIKSIENEQ